MRNGKRKEIEIKENVNFFKFKDGDYYTIDALCQKYDCQHTHIYRRRTEFDIPQMTIMGVKVIKDSEHFVKLPKANNFGEKAVHLTNYVQLHMSVKEMIAEVKESNNSFESRLFAIESRLVVIEANLINVIDYLTKDKTDAQSS